MRELTFAQVRERWLAAGGKNTGGIITWFQPPVVERWVEREVPAGTVSDLRFIGAERVSGWDGLTGGTHRVGDMARSVLSLDFEWDPEWALIVVRDPENDQRVIIDGNERARELQRAVAAGKIPRSKPISLITGDLNLGVVRIAKSVSPLWR